MHPTYFPRDRSPMRGRLTAGSTKTTQQGIFESLEHLKKTIEQSAAEKLLQQAKIDVVNAIKGQGKDLQPNLFVKMLTDVLGTAEKAVVINFLFEYFTIHFGRNCDYSQEHVQSCLQSFRDALRLEDSVEELEAWVKSAGSTIGTYIFEDGLSFLRTKTAFDVLFQLVKPFNFSDAFSEIQKKLKVLNYVETSSKEIISPSLLRIFTVEGSEVSELRHFEVQQIARYLENSCLSFLKVLDKLKQLLSSVIFSNPDLSKEVLANALLKAFLNAHKKSTLDLFQLLKFWRDTLSEEQLSNFIKKNHAEICTILRSEITEDEESATSYWQSKSNVEWRAALNSIGMIFRRLTLLSQEREFGHAFLSLLLEQCNAKRKDLSASEHELVLTILKDVLLDWSPVQPSQLLVLKYLHRNKTESLEKHRVLSEERVETFKFELIKFFKISAVWLPSVIIYAQDYLGNVMTKDSVEVVERSNQCIAFLLSLLGEPEQLQPSISRHIRYRVVLSIVDYQRGKVFAGFSKRLFSLLAEGFKEDLENRLRLEPAEATLLEKILQPRLFSWTQIFELLIFLMQKANLPPLFLDTIIQGLFSQMLSQKSNYFACQAAILLYMCAIDTRQTLINSITVFDTLAICDCKSPEHSEISRFLKTYRVSNWMESVERVCCFVKNNDGESSAPLRVRLKVLLAVNHQLQLVLETLHFSEVKRLLTHLECLKISGFYANSARSEFTGTLVYFYNYFKKNPEIASQDFKNIINKWLDIFGISLSTFEVIAVNIVKYLDRLPSPSFEIESFFNAFFDLTKIDAFNFAEVHWRFKAEKISSTISLVEATLRLFSHRPSAIEWCLSALLSEASFHAVLDYEDLLAIIQLFDRYQSSAMISPTFMMNHAQKLESLATKSFRFSRAFSYLGPTSFPLDTEAFRPLYRLLKAYAVRWEINLTKCKIYYFKNWVGASKDSIETFNKLGCKSGASLSLRVALFVAGNSQTSQSCSMQLLKVADLCHKKIPQFLGKAKEDHFLGREEELENLRKIAESADTMMRISHECMQKINRKTKENIHTKHAIIEAGEGKILKGTPPVSHL